MIIDNLTRVLKENAPLTSMKCPDFRTDIQTVVTSSAAFINSGLPRLWPCNGDGDGDGRRINYPKDLLYDTAIAIGGGAVTYVLTAPVLNGVGFAAAGVTKASIAAGIHSSIGNVAAGSTFAVCQSIGATGIVPLAIPVAGAAAVASPYLIYKYWDHMPWKNGDGSYGGLFRYTKEELKDTAFKIGGGAATCVAAGFKFAGCEAPVAARPVATSVTGGVPFPNFISKL